MWSHLETMLIDWKCDENKPVCSNCISSERSCDFASPILIARPRHSSRSSSRVSRESLLPDDVHDSQESSQSPRERQQYSQEEAKTSPVDMEHVRLFYHLCTETFDSLQAEIDAPGVSLQDAFKEVLNAPYVLNELLALAALHLSTLNSDQKSIYHRQATELQTHALSIFNQMAPEVNAETCVPLMIFSSVLGMHEMCETLFFREPTFEHFLDNFIRSLCLNQGVRAVTGSSWCFLKESILGPMCKQGEKTVTPTGPPSGKTCSRLLELLTTANLDQEHKNSCEQAILALQSVLDESDRQVPWKPNVTSIRAWPVMVCKGYIDLLRMREPHGLVVLAHYGALIHLRRDLWICGDGGHFLVRLICDHLGNQWSDWLRWPIEVISGEWTRLWWFQGHSTISYHLWVFGVS